MPAEPGAADFGRYRLGRLLGRGGMGEVYLAHDVELDRDVAIKFVSADNAGDESAGRRLLHEAHAAASLDHPYICAVYETGRAPDGRGFIVMQYVEGQPLSALLENGPLPARDALSLAASIAEALSVAHRRGIVHRDLKPSNVMVTPSGRPKLLDFGIAKQVVTPGGASDAPTSSSGVTTAGTIIGTPAYMSPEQIQQRPLDGRSDLFSLGALLYESLTGHRTFQGPSTLETIANVLHMHPPAPSSLRADLSERHDELCGKLLAKDASDRFQSADEFVGAIRLLTETSRTTLSSGIIAPAPMPPGVRISRRTLLVVVSAIGLVVAGVAIRRRPSLPPVPPQAEVWYQRGVEAIREGAYLSGQRALEQAIAIHPQHVLAYARLADANIELDDEREAQTRLLKLSALVPDESRLPEPERLRIQAVRAFFLREVDSSIALQQRLVDRRPDDAGNWLDLGRAQEAAGLRTDARRSYEQSISKNHQYAPAYLRLGHVESLESRQTEATAAFAEAERLFRAASNIEGETEVLLRRGAMYDAFGDLKLARSDLERALTLANSASAAYQQVRIRLALSSVQASEGHLTEAETIASAAVREALANGLDTIAADGLIDLAATHSQLGRLSDARTQLARALELAEERGARRTVGRAKVQLAALQESQGQARQALTTIDGILPFLRSNRYRRYELYALSIASRAHDRLDELDQARGLASEALKLAETVKDDSQVALSANNLASVLTTLGRYPEALDLRVRSEAIHRQQGEQASLPYDLANRADLLIRLGRRDDAVAALEELDRGIAAGLPAYKTRARRVAFLRILAAATSLECGGIDQWVSQLAPASASADAGDIIGPAVADFCAARLGRRQPGPPTPPSEGTAPRVLRERAYWLAASALERHNPSLALGEATAALDVSGPPLPDEVRWRLAAVGAAAARQTRAAARAAELAEVSRAALERLRASWKNHFERYGNRSDVVYLIRQAG